VAFRRHKSGAAGGWARLRRARGNEGWGVYAVKLALIAGAHGTPGRAWHGSDRARGVGVMKPAPEDPSLSQALVRNVPSRQRLTPTPLPTNSMPELFMMRKHF
jgi:hypothetical protein